MTGRHRLVACSVLALAACRPELPDRPSLVVAPSVLAVRGDPAEAAAGDVVTYTLLVASPEGTVTMPAASWSVCTAPKPLTESNVVGAACLDDAANVSLGAPGPTASGPLPADACARFGPNPPPGDFRPRDADGTGGYYQPVRVVLDGVVAFGLERLACSLANAPLAVTQEFAARYVRNANPELAPLVARAGGSTVTLDAIPAGGVVELVASWPASAAESYVRFDVATQRLVDDREALRVSWFATDGSFAQDRTGRDAADPAVDSANTWTAPPHAATVYLWLVLRDSRGGVTWSEHTVLVR